MTLLRLNQTVDDSFLVLAKGNQDPRTIASSVYYLFGKNNEVVVRAVGAGAVNQAVKGIAIARGMVAQRGSDMICRIGFTDIIDTESDDGRLITAMMFRLTLE